MVVLGRGPGGVRVSEEKYVTIFNEDTNDSGFILFSKALMKELKEKGWNPGDALKVEMLAHNDGIRITNTTKPYRAADQARKEAISIDME